MAIAFLQNHGYDQNGRNAAGHTSFDWLILGPRSKIPILFGYHWNLVQEVQVLHDRDRMNKWSLVCALFFCVTWPCVMIGKELGWKMHLGIGIG